MAEIEWTPTPPFVKAPEHVDDLFGMEVWASDLVPDDTIEIRQDGPDGPLLGVIRLKD